MGFFLYRILLASVSIAALMRTPPPEKFELQGLLSGHDTKLEVEHLALIEDEATWKELWLAHKGQTVINGLINADATEAPFVEFSHTMVVAFYSGPRANVTGFELQLVEAKPKKIVIRLAATHLPAGQQVVTTPYALLQVTPTKRPIELQVSFDGKRWESAGTLTRVSPMPKK